MMFLELIMLPGVDLKNIKSNLLISFYLEVFFYYYVLFCLFFFLPKVICREMYNG